MVPEEKIEGQAWIFCTSQTARWTRCIGIEQSCSMFPVLYCWFDQLFHLSRRSYLSFARSIHHPQNAF
jgi:hypothetical protein